MTTPMSAFLDMCHKSIGRELTNVVRELKLRMKKDPELYIDESGKPSIDVRLGVDSVGGVVGFNWELRTGATAYDVRTNDFVGASTIYMDTVIETLHVDLRAQLEQMFAEVAE